MCQLLTQIVVVVALIVHMKDREFNLICSSVPLKQRVVLSLTLKMIKTLSMSSEMVQLCNVIFEDPA